MDPFGRFSWIMMTLVGVPHHIWPEVRDTTGPFCHTDAQVFGAAIPVNAVVGDQQAAMFGQCGFHKGDVKATFGTGTFCNVNTALQPLATIAGLYPIVGKNDFRVESRKRVANGPKRLSKNFATMSLNMSIIIPI